MNQNDRFQHLSNEAKQTLLDAALPANTKKRNEWAMRVFNEWMSVKKKVWAEEGGLFVLKDNQEICRGDLDFLLQDFIFSVRKENKEEYPPSSLRSLVSGIMSYFRNTYSRNWNFFKDNDFS